MDGAVETKQNEGNKNISHYPTNPCQERSRNVSTQPVINLFLTRQNLKELKGNSDCTSKDKHDIDIEGTSGIVGSASWCRVGCCGRSRGSSLVALDLKCVGVRGLGGGFRTNNNGILARLDSIGDHKVGTRQGARTIEGSEGVDIADSTGGPLHKVDSDILSSVTHGSAVAAPAY